MYDVSSDMQLSHVCPSWSFSPLFGSCPLYLRSYGSSADRCLSIVMRGEPFVLKYMFLIW